MFVLIMKAKMFPDTNYVHSSKVTCKLPDYNADTVIDYVFSHASGFYVPCTTIHLPTSTYLKHVYLAIRVSTMLKNTTCILLITD